MSPEAPFLSIVIVAYKSSDEIVGCLSSLPRELDRRKVEVLVVDNSAGDGTGEIVGRRFPWVKYIAPGKNLGFGRANNLGYAMSDVASEFVLFLNPDTVCNDGALRHCINRLRAESNIGLVSPRLELADGSMDLACRRSIPSLWDGFCRASGLAAAFPGTALFSGYNLTHRPESGTYDVGAINGAFMMGRRVAFEAIAMKTTAESLEMRAESGPRVESSELRVEGPDLKELSARSSEPKAYGLPPTASSNTYAAHVFDESFFMYGDDLDLCIRVARAGWRIVYDGSVSITHLKGVSVAKDYQQMSCAIFDANRDVYLKHFNPTRSRLVALKYRLAFGLWKRVARLRALLKAQRRVRPL
jgi:N-acetylglucosaminyl-diphospho-decaprenol L-rhamnosyltransferase